ncbi:hypothetical protein V6Z12_D09G192400 [Gossypium hirsutum]
MLFKSEEERVHQLLIRDIENGYFLVKFQDKSDFEKVIS